jgi:hypothetical protein
MPCPDIEWDSSAFCGTRDLFNFSLLPVNLPSPCHIICYFPVEQYFTFRKNSLLWFTYFAFHGSRHLYMHIYMYVCR